ncbi:MAG: DUF222 domain-containing protein, partial [Actinomycetota bacterium]|nr:DUF222 domain-containing protein [Actinomycetota bacterium]
MFDLELAPRFSDQELEELTVSEFAAWDGVEPDRHLVPPNLDTWEPGPRLAAVLSSVDRSSLSGFDTVRIMKARNRQVAHDQAELAADMVEVSYRADAEMGRTEEAFEYASDEIRAALTLTRRAAESELGFATDLWERLPQVWEALNTGKIDVREAKTIVYGTSHV